MKILGLLLSLALFVGGTECALSAPKNQQVVTNIAEMQQLGAASSQVAHVHVSYFVSSPYGGGDFDWKAGSCTADGGIYFSANGVSTSVGCWVREVAPDADYLLTWFGGVPNDSGNYTATLVQCYTSAALTKKTCAPDGGQYILTPGTTKTDASGTVTVALPMVDNMSVHVPCRSSLKIVNSFSTNGSPKPYYMFFSNTVNTNVAIFGDGQPGCSVLDANGANNLMGGNNYNDSLVAWSAATTGGVDACGSNVVINGLLLEHVPGSNVLVMAQPTASGGTLCKKATISNNTFLDNGLSSTDHSTIFSWMEDVEIFQNRALSTVPFGTVPGIGPTYFLEVHGANQRVHDNHVQGYASGTRLGGNLTADSNNIFVHSEDYRVLYLGISIERNLAAETTTGNMTINNISCTWDDTSPGVGAAKTCVNFSPQYAVSNIMIDGIHVNKTCGTGAASVGVQIASSLNAAQVNTGLSVRNVDTTCVGIGVNVTANATNGLGSISIANINTFNCTPDASVFTTAKGIAITGSSTGISSLSIDGNNVQDSRGSPVCDYGALVSGIIGNYYYRPGVIKGVTTPYSESGVTISGTRRGFFSNMTFTPSFKFGGVSITLGNGTLAGRWSMADDLVTLSESLTVGSTTTIPSGAMTSTTPFTAANVAPANLGTAQYYENSSGHYTNCAASLDYGTATLVSHCTGGGNSTDLSPITLGATSNSLTLQVQFPAQ